MPNLKRWAKRLSLAAGVLLVLFVFGVLPYLLASLATTRRFSYRDQENAGLTPASFGLTYEDVVFTASDGVPLSGWWVPASEPRGTVVLVHGLNRTRIEMVKKVPFLHRLGWNALLFDLRHHGASGGEVSGLGYLERRDVLAGKALAGTRGSGRVVFWGISLGGAAATLAAAEDPQVAGLVCDSTYRSLGDTVRHHLRLFRGFTWWTRAVPVWPLGDEVLFWIGRRAGFDTKAADVRAAAARLAGRPVLFVCNSADRRMPPEIASELRAAAGPRARLLVVPGRSHGGAYREGTTAYESAVAGLLAEVVEPPQVAAGP
ncbi:MAG TPA: alpha/beta fold hydrolase [Vicinamibacteria bacterium]|nr:alpha/beta fold hydrolase [Vicinamibacteria bacterium]